MIYTFYSFKGGVGRSMALANIAELLYRGGLKVLMVDFDLEAPGLESYFNVQEASHTPADVLSKRGMIEMLLSFKELRSLPRLNQPQAKSTESSRGQAFPFPVEPLTNFIVPIYKENKKGGTLSLIPAGYRAGDKFTHYAECVRFFNWDDFYANWDGELFFEWFRSEAGAIADVVLVDSRTGVTEMSGVCTYHLADVVVMFIGTNQQSLQGTLRMARSLSDQKLVEEGRKGRPLSLVLVPSRVDQDDKTRLDIYEEQFNSMLGRFVSPQLKFEKSAFIDLMIPYRASYAYEENVAVRESERASEAYLVEAFERLAFTLAQLAPATNSLSRLYNMGLNRLVMLEAPPVIDYSGLIANYTRDFIGREWVFDAINDWLADSEGPRYFVLTGEPGSGKTAIACRLNQFSQGEVGPPNGLTSLIPGFLSAIHFCSARDRRWISPYVFVESLAVQLAAHYSSYLKTLVEKGSDRQVHIVSERRIHEGSAGQIEVIKSLSVNGGSAENAFGRIIREPLEVLFQNDFNDQIIILVDGLDEALLYSGEMSIVSLLSQTEHLPSGVRFIVTTRPNPEVLRPLQHFDLKECSLTLGEGLTHSLDDVRRYVLQVLGSSSKLLEKLDQTSLKNKFTTAVQEKSQGNFLYVDYLLKMLEAQPTINQKLLDVLPKGIDRVYIEFLERLVFDSREAWHEIYSPILGTLAVTPESLTEEQLANFTGMTRSGIRQKLNTLRQFLDVYNEALPASKRKYQIYHRSFADFLKDENRAEEYWCETREQHKRIVQYYRSRCSGKWWKLITDDYARKYLTMHMFEAGLYEELHALIAEGESQIEWAEARLRVEGSYEGYLSDVDIAWHRTEGEDGWDIGRQIRYALIKSSTRSLAANITPLLLMQLVKTEIWKPAIAFEYIQQIPDQRQRIASLKKLVPLLKVDSLKFEVLAVARAAVGARNQADALFSLVEYLPEKLKAEAIQEAWTAIQAITNKEEYASALISHLKYVSAEIQEQALKAIQDITDERIRVRTLLQIAENVSTNLKAQIVDLVLSIDNERIRASALVELLAYLPDDLKAQTVNEILAMAQKTADEVVRVFVLLNLMDYLSDELKTQLLKLVIRIVDEDERSTALIKLAAYLPSELKAQVLILAQQIANETLRAYTLSKIGENYGGPKSQDSLRAKIR